MDKKAVHHLVRNIIHEVLHLLDTKIKAFGAAKLAFLSWSCCCCSCLREAAQPARVEEITFESGSI